MLDENFVVSPNLTIKKYIKELNMKRREFIELFGKGARKLLRGKLKIDDYIATRLYFILGISAIYFLKLQELYDK